MNKRMVCARNVYRVKVGKPVLLVDETKCSFEKYEKRNPMPKVVKMLRDLADNIDYNLSEPDYDPHGFTVTDLFTDTVVKFLNTIHSSYRASIMKEIQERVKNGKV